MQTSIEHQALVKRQNIFLRKKRRNNSDSSAENNHYLKKAKRKILLIEDSEVIQVVEKNYLQEFGYAVDIAKNGNEALKLFKNNYDLIFLDIGLPDISGIDVAKYIRKYEDETGIKRNIIIVLSSDENNSTPCYEAGCDAFHTKPINPDVLKSVLNQWLPLKIR